MKKNVFSCYQIKVFEMSKRLIIILLVVCYCCLNCAATNRALLVGIGKYPTAKTGWKPIHGDVDIELLVPSLKKNGFTDIKTLINQNATKNNIVSALRALAVRCQLGDKVYFHFSGHGQPIADENNDEDGEFDESMVPFDAYRASYTTSYGKYEGQNHLIDDEYNPLLNTIKKKIGAKGEMFVVIDACYSEGMERGDEDELGIEDKDILTSARGTSDPFIVKGHSKYLKGIPQPKRFTQGALLTIVSACLKTERNYEYKTATGKMYGSLSFYIYTLLKSDANFSRWIKCFEQKDYKRYKIFQIIQHPTITIYK